MAQRKMTPRAHYQKATQKHFSAESAKYNLDHNSYDAKSYTKNHAKVKALASEAMKHKIAAGDYKDPHEEARNKAHETMLKHPKYGEFKQATADTKKHYNEADGHFKKAMDTNNMTDHKKHMSAFSASNKKGYNSSAKANKLAEKHGFMEDNE